MKQEMFHWVQKTAYHNWVYAKEHLVHDYSDDTVKDIARQMFEVFNLLATVSEW